MAMDDRSVRRRLAVLRKREADVVAKVTVIRMTRAKREERRGTPLPKATLPTRNGKKPQGEWSVGDAGDF